MPLMAGAEPITVDGNRTGVLLVHGFTSTPQSMRDWARFLADAGYTVSAPRLPGHGTSLSECNRTTWHDWYAEVARAFDALRARCDQVFVFGQSMGGTLSLRLAADRGEQVAGLVLVNPSVFTTRPDRHLLPVLARVVPAWPGIANDIKKKDGEAEVAYDKIPVKAAYSLSKLWANVKPDIPRVSQPILIFTSPDDHTVEPENSDYLLEHVNSVDRHQELLPDSYHVATLDNDAPQIFADSLAFIQRLTE
ncbi:MAG: alpha/beta fold hydrolase [Candidatus Nanopelagicales bacterium]